MNVRRAGIPILLLGLLLMVSLATPGPGVAGVARGWKQSAARIDGELRGQWKRAGIEAAPLADDAAFVRRVTLDLIGRIPTADQARTFIDDRSTDKRRIWVEHLLSSDEYAEHWADVYSDLLLGRDLRLRRKVPATARQYLVTAFADNRPLDRIAADLLTAEGTVEDDGAAAFILAQGFNGGNRPQLAGATARVLLGTQIQCAQCHDHPYDRKLKKKDFEAFTAWFEDVRIRRVEVAGERRPALFDRPARRRPASSVEPTFLGREVEPQADETRRQTLARTLVGSDLFAKAIVNRTWGQLLGSPISGPWDDLGHENDPDHPRLLEVLAAELEASGFDHRRLLQSIVLSSTYQRAATGGSGPDLEARFARAAVRPLGADALFASLLTASGLEQSGRKIATDRARQNALREFLFVLDDDEMTEADAFTGSIAQALLLRNGRVAHIGSRANGDLALGRILAAGKDPGQRLEQLFLTAYARRPTEAERTRYLRYLEGRDQARLAYEDLFHALLSSTEFVTNH